MDRISGFVNRWMGLCPKTGTLSPQAPVHHPPAPAASVTAPNGGTGGSGRVLRGFSLAQGSLTILLENSRLLWLSVLAGFILLFGGLIFSLFWGSLWMPLSRITTDLLVCLVYGPGPAMVQPNAVRNAADLLNTAVFSFTFSLAISFCLALLLTALIHCVTEVLENRPFTLSGGLSAAGMHVRGLLGYAAVLAAAGTLVTLALNAITWRGDTFMTPEGTGYTAYNAATIPLSLPGMVPVEIPVACFRTVATFVLLLVTIYVIPIIVFERTGITETVARSGSLLRKTWREALIFTVLLILVLSAMAVTFDIPWEATSGTFLLVLLLWALAIVAVTVAAIMLVGLYLVATTGGMPGAFLRGFGSEHPSLGGLTISGR